MTLAAVIAFTAALPLRSPSMDDHDHLMSAAERPGEQSGYGYPVRAGPAQYGHVLLSGKVPDYRHAGP